MRQGYEDGYLRKSVVMEPLFSRENTGDNTPAVIHTEIVPGDALRIQVVPKGAGSENMGAVKMLKPADGWKAPNSLFWIRCARPAAIPARLSW